ncbi:MAG: NUDIX hydrolase [Desulfobaccales bacterium]
MNNALKDARLWSPQCFALSPIETVHENPWFTVRNRGGYFTAEYNHLQVSVLPIVAQRAILMVRPDRPLLADCPLELPSGGVNRNESPLQGARRELAEETGVHIPNLERFRPLPPMSTAPNRDPRLLHVFQVEITQEEFDGRQEHDQEITRLELLRFEELVDLLTAGQIYVTVPVALISRYLLAIYAQAPATDSHRGGWE